MSKGDRTNIFCEYGGVVYEALECDKGAGHTNSICTIDCDLRPLSRGANCIAIEYPRKCCSSLMIYWKKVEDTNGLP